MVILRRRFTAEAHGRRTHDGGPTEVGRASRAPPARLARRSSVFGARRDPPVVEAGFSLVGALVGTHVLAVRSAPASSVLPSQNYAPECVRVALANVSHS